MLETLRSDLFNAAGITTPKNHKWKGQAIGKMLDNPVYAALSLVDNDFVAAQWPTIVKRATWDAVRRRRAADPRRRINLGTPRPHSPYLLSGLITLGKIINGVKGEWELDKASRAARRVGHIG